MTALAGSPVLTWADRELRAAFSLGLPLNLKDAGSHPDFGGLAAGDTGTTVHAWLIRDLLLAGDLVPPGHIRQLSLTGATVEGQLDLRLAKTDCPLRLEECTFGSPIMLSEANLRSVSLRGSIAGGIDARHASFAGDLVLDSVRLSGPLRLTGAHLEDDLRLQEARIDVRHQSGGGDPGIALDLDNAKIKGKIDAGRLRIRGKVSMIDAVVNGPVQMGGAHIRPIRARDGGSQQAREAWCGDGLAVGGDLDLSGLRATGSVRLIDARVLSLVLADMRIWNPGVALLLDRLETRGSVFCRGNSRVNGGVQGVGIQVGATLYLGSGIMRIGPKARAAADLRRAKVAGDVVFDDSFQAVGGLSLAGARISGQVLLGDATLQAAGHANAGAPGGIALSANRAHIGDVRCAAGFTCQGAVTFEHAQIGGRFLLQGATLRAAGRPGAATVPRTADGPLAFSASHATLGSDLCCRELTCDGVMSLVNASVGGAVTVQQAAGTAGERCVLVATGVTVMHDVFLDTAGTVDLSGGRISGDVDLHLARLDAGNAGQPAADLSAVTADVLSLRGEPHTGLLDLTRASVTLLLDDPDHRSPDSPVVLAGFTYDDIAGTDINNRLKWLETGTRLGRSATAYREVRFSYQPYLQLAAVYQRTGRDYEARKVLCRMYREHNKKITSWRQLHSKLWNYFQDAFLGYGYVPSRALLSLLVLTGLTTYWFAYLDSARIGIIQAAIISLGFALPGSAYDRIESWGAASTASHVIAAVLVLGGLIFGAAVVAAIARVIKR